MRSPLISVTFGFFSVAGGCSSIGDFPSWARTFMVANIEIDRAKSSSNRIDFIDLPYVWRRAVRLGCVRSPTVREGKLRKWPSLTVGLLTRSFIRFHYDEPTARQS